jgi:hypothetical protein
VRAQEGPDGRLVAEAIRGTVDIAPEHLLTGVDDSSRTSAADGMNDALPLPWADQVTDEPTLHGSVERPATHGHTRDECRWISTPVTVPAAVMPSWHHARMLKPPVPDPDLDPLRGGVAELRRDGEVAGHVATQVGTFWSPLSFSRRRRWWVWYIVAWADGARERSEEDYPPWTVVSEIRAGTFTWDDGGDHDGTYTVHWLPEPDRQRMLTALAIRPEDF